MARNGRAYALRGTTPFPTKQLTILAICRICEPIAFMSIFPYAYYMVESFGVAHDKAQISMYVGMVTSAFAFMEALSGMFWGRLSDRIGRKKVLLGGLFGTGLSMLLFGFATNIWMAVVARALGGLLNGNIGVLQTTVAELVTVEKHQARAYSIMPFVWCLGTIIGASLGGLLARPATNFPSLFSAGSIFHAYPYLLPNLVCTAFVVCGLAVGVLFLEETHEDMKHNHDRGRELGQWLLSKVLRQDIDMPLSDKDGSLDEMRSMLDGHGPGAYSSTDSSPTLCSSSTSIAEPPPYSLEKHPEALANVRSAFTKQVLLHIVSYGILAFHTISLEQLIPTLMSREEPGKDTHPQLPFKFKGGFHFSTKTIGIILSIQGVLQMFAQLVLFPWFIKQLGRRRTFWLTIFSYPFLYVIAPYLALLPKDLRIPGIMALLAWKVTAQSLSFPSLNMMLANAAPSKRVLGTVNGAGAATASLCRGFGPTVTGAVDALGDSLGLSGLAWWTCAGIAVVAWVPGIFIKEERNRQAFRANFEDEEECLGEAMVGSDTASVITLTPDEAVEAVLSRSKGRSE